MYTHNVHESLKWTLKWSSSGTVTVYCTVVIACTNKNSLCMPANIACLKPILTEKHFSLLFDRSSSIVVHV